MPHRRCGGRGCITSDHPRRQQRPDRGAAQPRRREPRRTDGGHFSYPFQVCNPSRIEQRFTIYAEKAPVELATPFLPSLRERTDKASKRAEERVLKLGFVDEVCPPPHSIDHAKPVLEDVRLPPLARTGFTLVGVLEMGEALKQPR